MTNVFIIHGAYGDPEENWFPWLKSQLEKLNCRVFVPQFPSPKKQTLDNWFKIFKPYQQYLNRDTIIIGHSLGPAFLLSILEKLNQPIKAAFFISGFVGLLGNKDFDKINKTFVDKEFHWQKIKQNCPKFLIFHSDNDPYVPLEKAEQLAKILGVEVIIVKNAGHFNEEARYNKFALLLKKIKDEL